jgi:phosphate transport system substrate-binding protein
MGLPVCVPIVFVLTLALRAGGIRGASPTAEVASVGQVPGVTAENYPGVNGSTSTRPLGHLLAARTIGLPAELRRLTDPVHRAVNMGFSALRTDGQNPVCVVPPLESDVRQIPLYYDIARTKARHYGTHGAYVSLSSGSSAMILVARKPSEDELQAAQGKRVKSDARPVALGAFAFLVNVDNPVEGLTLEQIRAIYTGKVKNWNEVGGRDVPIEAFTRNPNSGSQELMEELGMQGIEMIDTPDRMLMGMAGPIDLVASRRNAIAYSVYYYEHVMSPHPGNKLIAIDGIMPTAETIIASRKCPLATEVYVVTRKGAATDSPEVKLRDWLLSEEGQKLVVDSGYVPIRGRKKTKQQEATVAVGSEHSASQTEPGRR